MKQFRTILSNNPPAHLLKLKDKILTLGSCFADVIGSRLQANKIIAEVNPFGAIFNPHSIHKILKYIVEDTLPSENTFVQNKEIFLNYDFHSKLAALNISEVQKIIKDKIHASHNILKSAQWLVITYGTAWVYSRKDNDEIVANCHKLPNQQFYKTLLTHKQIINSFDEVYKALKSFNSEIKIILTVSPVRHLKDTLVLNSVSKSVLRLACHTISTSYNDVNYFPAYEIMMDDLRDYRFYKPDMIHPSEEAEDYIWQSFIDAYADEGLKKFLRKWNELSIAISHKPFHIGTEAHQTFLRETIHKFQMLGNEVNVDAEVELLTDQLVK